MDDGDPMLRAVVAEDPLAKLPIGSALRVEHSRVPESNASDVAYDVRNWGFFDGAVAAIMLRDREGLTVVGSGVVIAPGLVVTAAHVLDDRHDDLQAGSASVLLFAPREDGMDLWRLRSIT